MRISDLTREEFVYRSLLVQQYVTAFRGEAFFSLDPGIEPSRECVCLSFDRGGFQIQSFVKANFLVVEDIVGNRLE